MRFKTLPDRKCIIDTENGGRYCFNNIFDMQRCHQLLTQLDDERKSLNKDYNKQLLLGSNGYNPFRDFEIRNQNILKGDSFLLFLKKQGVRNIYLDKITQNRKVDTYFYDWGLNMGHVAGPIETTLYFKVPLLNLDERMTQLFENEMNYLSR